MEGPPKYAPPPVRTGGRILMGIRQSPQKPDDNLHIVYGGPFVIESANPTPPLPFQKPLQKSAHPKNQRGQCSQGTSVHAKHNN